MIASWGLTESFFRVGIAGVGAFSASSGRRRLLGEGFLLQGGGLLSCSSHCAGVVGVTGVHSMVVVVVMMVVVVVVLVVAGGRADFS